MMVRFASTTLCVASFFSASILGAMLLGAAPPSSHAPPSKPGTPPAKVGSDPAQPTGEVDPKWLDHLPKDDRAALDPLVGYAPPEFTKDLNWFSGEALTWDSLRG